MNQITAVENILNIAGDILSICFGLLMCVRIALHKRYQLQKNPKWTYITSLFALLTGMVICIGPWKAGTPLIVIIYVAMGWTYFDQYRKLVSSPSHLSDE